MTLEENKATDIIDNPSDKIDPLDEGEDSTKLEGDVMRDLGSLEDDLMDLFKSMAGLDDAVKEEICNTLFRNFSITNYETTTLDLGGFDVDNLLRSFGDDFDEITSSIKENPLVNERKKKLLNNEVTFDTIDQLNKAINEDSDKILLLKGLNELGLSTNNFLILAGCMGLHGGIISLNTSSSNIKVPYIQLESSSEESSPKVIVFANGHLYEGKDERLACMDWISSINNGDNEVPSNKSEHLINFNGNNSDSGKVELKGTYNSNIRIDKVEIISNANAKIKQTESTNENVEEGDIGIVHTAVESTSVSAGVSTKIGSGIGIFDIGVSGSLSNDRTFSHTEGIDGNSRVFESCTLINNGTINLTINGGYLQDENGNSVNLFYNFESTNNSKTHSASVNVSVGGFDLNAKGTIKEKETQNDGEPKAQTNHFNLGLSQELTNNFFIVSSFGIEEDKVGGSVGVTNKKEDEEEDDNNSVTYRILLDGERDEGSREVGGNASIDNIPLGGSVNISLNGGFRKQTDDENNRIDNTSFGLGLSAGEQGDLEKIGGVVSFNYDHTRNNGIPTTIYTLNGSGNFPLGRISLAPQANYNRINENGEITNNIASTIGANIPVGPNSLLITPSFGFNSQKIGDNSAANNFIFSLNAEGQYGPLTVDRLSKYATGEGGGFTTQATLGLIVYKDRTKFDAGLTGSYNQTTGLGVGVKFILTY